MQSMWNVLLGFSGADVTFHFLVALQLLELTQKEKNKEKKKKKELTQKYWHSPFRANAVIEC